MKWIQVTIVTLIAVITVVLVGSVVRDRNALVEDRHGAETGVAPGTAASPESVNTSETVFRKASPSVVVVKIFNSGDKRMTGLGSGVVVAPFAVATNRHVVEAGGEIRVFDQGRSYAATVLHADREYDLCTLSVPGLPAPPADLASVGTIRAGQRVYAIGAPKGLELSISDGLVSAVRPYGEFPLIQTNAPISKGSSGGGLFDTDGRLVGITTASAIDGQNINFALAADLVPLLPSRSADIGTLDPIVPVKRADEIANKELLAQLREGRQAIAASETELKTMAGEIDRHTTAMNELRQSMDGFIPSGNMKAYNDMVPQFNRMNNDRNELVKRFEQKRQTHSALIEQHNRTAERYNDQGRLQP